MESFKKYITEAPDYDSFLLRGAPGENDVSCPACRDGMCPNCGGKGGRCQTCKGTGDCIVCQGAGEVDRLTAQKYVSDNTADDFDNDSGEVGPHPLY